MAKIIEGDENLFAAMTYGANATPALDAYVQNEYAQAYGKLNDVGAAFMKTAEKAYHDFLNSDTLRVARAATRRIASVWGEDRVTPLDEVWKVQNAPNKMVRWIMAEPTIRKLHHKQQCEGYGDRYKDLSPNDVGEDHDDYCLVNNGIVHMDEETGDWQATSYSNSWDETELEYEDQLAILDSWRTVADAVANGKDPTSKWDDNLG